VGGGGGGGGGGGALKSKIVNKLDAETGRRVKVYSKHSLDEEEMWRSSWVFF
jgi:hypothetical protein